MYEREIRIRWGDVGADGCVGIEAILTYLDELVGDWLATSLGDSWVTLHVDLDLRAPILYEHGRAIARVELDRLGTASVTGRLALLAPDGTTTVEGRYVLAAWDAAIRRTRPLTDADRATLGVG